MVRFSEAVQDAIDAGWIDEGDIFPSEKECLEFYPRPKPPKPTTWTTKDGRVIQIRDMSDGHLFNTVRLIRRTCVAKLAKTVIWYTNCAGPGGDMSQMAFDQEFRDLLESDWRDYAPPVLRSMVEEAKRRGGEVEREVVGLVEDDMREVQTGIEVRELLASRRK